MASKVSVQSIVSPEREGFLTKQGGKVKNWKKRWFVLKGDTIYYFKTQKAQENAGEIVLCPSAACNPDPVNSKKGKYRFSVQVPDRLFLMFCDTEKGMQQWVDSISKAINSSSGDGASPAVASTVGTSSTSTPENNTPTTTDEQSEKSAPEAEKSADSNDSAVVNTNETPAANLDNDKKHLSKLMAAKDAIPFLTEDGSKVFEFWTIWADSIPNAEDMAVAEADEKLEYHLATSAKRQKLTWRAAGPQIAFIQKMVDFFWNVGAPESEIDKLNDVGALINPTKIGSWIDMSSFGGMDGGWYFPVDNTVDLALAAGDAGEPTTKVGEWAATNKVDSSYSVGRDMGAAPPRQTETFFTLPGDLANQIALALDAFTKFGFPEIPQAAKDILQNHSNPGVRLSVVTSAEGFVRLGILVPSPDADTVDKLCGIVDASPDPIHELEGAISSKGPSFVEYQHLNLGFGYGVYNEGFDIVFHYSLNGE